MAAAKLKNHRDAKQANHESTRTIDHFFSKRSDSSNNPGNLNTTKKATTSKRLLDKRPALHNSDVIIIDSDDEVDIAPTRAEVKKRRLDDDSDSDIEIVDVNSTITSHATVEPTLSLARGAVASGSISPAFSFGKPGLLRDAVSKADSDLAFGNAGSLLQSRVTPESFPPETSGVKEEENTLVDIDLSEEWLMDDDEIDKYTFREDDDDEVEFVEETLTSRNDSFFIELCPCCKLKLQPSVRRHSDHLFSLVHEMNRRLRHTSTVAWTLKRVVSRLNHSQHIELHPSIKATPNHRQAAMCFLSLCLPSKKIKLGKRLP
jgi:hypothetical protein